jgi:dipeptidyl aminopeptidase/acylaminoacyl peptidase
LGHPSETPPAPGQTPKADDLRIVYLKDGDIWIWRDGSTKPLTHSGGVYLPNLSPDGQVVAFLQRVDDFHVELWAVNADGTNQRRLVSITDLDTIGASVRDPSAVAINPYHYEWAAGTHILAFNTQQVFQGPGLSIDDDFNLVNVDTGEVKFVLLAGWGGEFALSPDGKRVALSTPTNIILANVDGSDWRSLLTYEAVATYSEYRYYAQPLWSPDGSLLRVAIPPADPLAEPRQPTSLWLIPADGAPAQQVGSVPAAPFQDIPVTFSPDLATIIYFQEVGAPAENRRGLHIARPDGSGDWIYQQGNLVQFLGWSSDGRHFLFSQSGDQAMQLGSLDAPAAPASKDAVGIIAARWVDEGRYLFVEQRGEVFDLYLGAIDGGVVLLDTLAADSPPVFDFSSTP